MRSLLTKKITIFEWELDLIVVILMFVGLVTGVYLSFLNLFPIIRATTAASISIATDTNFSQGTLTSTEISGSGTSAVVQLQGQSGPDNTTYYKPITIDNTSNTNTLTEYQIFLENIDTAALVSSGKLQSDCDDLRFTNSSGSVTLPHFIVPTTCNTTNTKIWVKVDTVAASANTTIRMYYSSPSATNSESESGVFSYSSEKTVGYVLDNAVNDLQIISLEAGNTVTHNSVTRTLGAFNTNSFTSISRFSPVTAKKLFNADDSSNDTDSLVPISWAGTEFLFFQRSNGTANLHMIAPWQDATVNVYNGNTLQCGSISVTSAGSDSNCSLNTGQVRITSTVPILIFYSLGTTDPMPLHPSSLDSWIGGSQSTLAIAGSSGADYRYIRNTDSSEQNPADLTANNYSNLSGSSYGASPAFLIRSTDNAIVSHQYADADGGDAHMFGTISEMGTRWGSAVSTDYISIASNQAFTCTVYNTSGGQIATGTGTSSNSSVYFLGFGTGSSNVLTSNPWYMDCDVPVFAHYQKATDTEASLWSYPMMRQFTYPTPSPSVGSETTALAPTGTWESATNSNVLDLIWNGGWGDGGSGSTAFSATFSDVSVDGTISFQMRVADSLANLTSATYQLLGTVSSGTTFTATKSDLDGLGLSTGNNRYVQIKATLTTNDGITNPKLDDFTIFYLADDTPPTNASSIQMLTSAGGSTVTIGEWTSGSSPYFSWTQGTDSDSGILGYCAYLGSDSGGDPSTTKGLLGTSPVSTAGTTCQFIISTTNLNFATASYKGSPWLSSSSNLYYLHLKAIDKNKNIASSSTSFNFKFDNTLPGNPSGLSAPQGYQREIDSFTIAWATSGDNVAIDNHSGIKGYQYRIGSGGIWYGSSHSSTQDCTDLITSGSYTLDQTYDSLSVGENTFYIRTWDNACNVSSTYVTAILKYNADAPSAPQNLVATPTSNSINSFSFSWDIPNDFQGAESGLSYCYTINTQPSASTCTFTSNNSLSADAYATQPQVNTFYLVTKDEAGNINYSDYASVDFTADTLAPGLPRNIDVSDVSIKNTENWKLAISWDEPENVGSGPGDAEVDHYAVYRSIEATSCSDSFSDFNEIGSIAGTTYVDTNLDQQNYYYCVKACDSTNNCSATSETSTGYPDGKFTEPAELIAQPTISGLTTKKATISWATDRTSDSKIAFGTESETYFEEEPSNSDQVIEHSITLNNLNPGTTYYYVAKWTDEDGNTGISDELLFTTDPAPTVKDVTISSIGLNNAVIKYTTVSATKAKIYYGPTTAFGGASETTTSPAESTYTTILDSLTDGTKYNFKINTFDTDGYEYEGTILDFTTIARPQISDVRVQQIVGTAQTAILVTWNSNTEISSIVDYYPTDTPTANRTEVDVNRVSGEHRSIVSGLLAQTPYSLVVRGIDGYGNEATSDIQSFTTATDTRPPKITNLKVDSSVVSTEGSQPSAQVVVTWDTDEPTTSQIEFAEGTGTTYSQKTLEDSNLTSNHLVVISGLSPSKVYHLRAVSQDSAGNIGTSVDTVTITPKATTNALDLVIGNLREVFGFLGDL